MLDLLVGAQRTHRSLVALGSRTQSFGDFGLDTNGMHIHAHGRMRPTRVGVPQWNSPFGFQDEGSRLVLEPATGATGGSVLLSSSISGKKSRAISTTRAKCARAGRIRGVRSPSPIRITLRKTLDSGGAKCYFRHLTILQASPLRVEI